MTVITTPTTAPNVGLGVPGLAPQSGAGFLTATGQTARRTILQFCRTPQLLVLPTIMGALFLLIFRYIFGGAIDAGGSADYVDFSSPASC
jgi:ABC-2 type transport system permease protein